MYLVGFSNAFSLISGSKFSYFSWLRSSKFCCHVSWPIGIKCYSQILLIESLIITSSRKSYFQFDQSLSPSLCEYFCQPELQFYNHSRLFKKLFRFESCPLVLLSILHTFKVLSAQRLGRSQTSHPNFLGICPLCIKDLDLLKVCLEDTIHLIETVVSQERKPVFFQWRLNDKTKCLPRSSLFVYETFLYKCSSRRSGKTFLKDSRQYASNKWLQLLFMYIYVKSVLGIV